MKKDTETTVMHSNLIEGNTGFTRLVVIVLSLKPLKCYESVSMFHAIVKVQTFSVFPTAIKK